MTKYYIAKIGDTGKYAIQKGMFEFGQFDSVYEAEKYIREHLDSKRTVVKEVKI